MQPADSDRDFSRRGFFVASSAILAASSVAGSPAAGASGIVSGQDKKSGPFELPPLPWKEDALEPVISARTIGFHHGKHHKAYADNLQKLVTEKPRYAAMQLEDVIRAAAKESADVAVFNNAAQLWNHTFYWASLKPGAGAPTGRLLEKIRTDLGSLDECKKQLRDAAKGQFGSGWAWLVVADGKLKVLKTGNADTPIVQGHKPLLTIDVWEHAYYLDYMNKRADYVDALVDKLLDWEGAAQRLG